MVFGDGTSRVDFNVPTFGPKKQRQTFVLLFDGTGNKFHGTDEDSCILKILRLLDRNFSNQKHYYQPGIGTYVQSSTYSHTSPITRAYSWIKKTRDQAIGSSFAEHVMGGYKFLMQHYNQGDDIYIFGFSRGAYTARFLAEMLDYVGLLEVGNEELARFAWKAFARWQRRLDTTDEEKEEKKQIFEFLKSFRDTFSRPVRRLRFLGLFDTVNSVPHFETAFLQRSKFPYTAKSSALVIRHAVSIDERRAKFRQDLVQGSRQKSDAFRTRRARKDEKAQQRREKKQQQKGSLAVPNGSTFGEVGADRKPAHAPPSETNMARYRRPSRAAGRSRSPAARRSHTPSPRRPLDHIEQGERHSVDTDASSPMRTFREQGNDDNDDDDEADEALPQDIMEVWFPGEHSDIGGGWAVTDNEVPQSHVPLCWMVREAQRTGLRFDPVKMEEMNCGWDADYEEPHSDDEDAIPPHARNPTIPDVQVTTTGEPEPAGDRGRATEAAEATRPYLDRGGRRTSTNHAQGQRQRFHEHYHKAATRSTIHDSLIFGKGLPTFSVLAWKFMEHLPFRRMDLQDDGSWKPINWPLPLGEVRDIPDTAWIHASALRRMEHDPKYRPGNLIVGGGGRGMRVAPEKYGIGEWEVVHGKGDPVAECVVRVRRQDNGEKTVGGSGEKEFLGRENGKAGSNGMTNEEKS